ncbi:MAG: hypothetical protein JWO72_417 [Caulobacteraceae bacterium]|nr:hypothetical protein [Caulobacteraceae bacterium]
MTSKIDLMTTVKRSALAAVAGIALMAALPAAAQGPVGGAPIFGAPKPGTPNLSGKWINARPMAALKTVAGTAPPLNAAGKAAYAKHKADKKADPINECLMHGEPRLLYSSHPFLILQYANHVDFVHEVNHTFRITYFGEKLDPESDPQWLGHPTAKWDGKTLAIDSINYNDQTWLDYSGLPHGMKLKTQERYALSADGKTIAGKVTIDDPEFYTKPWTAAFTLKKQPGYDLKQFACMADHQM